MTTRKREKSGDYTITILVDRTPNDVYDAVNDVRGWWTGNIVGRTDREGATWTYRFQKLHRSTQKITEMVPGKRIVWHVVDSRLSFVRDPTEWNGTDIVFDIAPKGRKTQLRFTHMGLAPGVECYGDCSSAWRFYINGSLRAFIAKRPSGDRARARGSPPAR